MTLGDDLVLGERVLDVGRKINLSLGPLDEERALDLLPGGEGARDFKDLVNAYLEPTLEFDVIILVDGSASARHLGCDPLYLGWTSGLGEADGKTRRIHLAGSAYQQP